jgi:hypothetical protein
MLELSDIQSSQQELEDYYAQLRAQHVTPAWIGGGISIGQAQNPAFDLLGADESAARIACGRRSRHRHR